jgi:hypothetical protein
VIAWASVRAASASSLTARAARGWGAGKWNDRQAQSSGWREEVSVGERKTPKNAMMHVQVGWDDRTRFPVETGSQRPPGQSLVAGVCTGLSRNEGRYLRATPRVRIKDG